MKIEVFSMTFMSEVTKDVRNGVLVYFTKGLLGSSKWCEALSVDPL